MIDVEVKSMNHFKCREKTARGNVFHSKAKANHFARMCYSSRNYTRNPVPEGRKIRAYKCPCCPFYHVGKSKIL